MPKNRDNPTKPLGEPQPLDILERRLGSLLMDFVTHLSTIERRYDCITTFVDKYSKRIHLVPFRGTDSATNVAECFFDNIFQLHGLPYSIVPERDPKRTPKLWNHLISCCDIQLKISTRWHPHTDGWTEIMNRMTGNYLRCYCALNQDDRGKLLTSAEFATNPPRLNL